MFHTWNVFYDGEFFGQVQALTAQAARMRAYMTNGCASRYTGRSFDKFKVEKAY